MKHMNRMIAWLAQARRWWALLLLSLGVLATVSACGFLSSPKSIYVNQSILQSATNKKWDEISKTMRENGLNAEQPQIILMPDKQRIGAKFIATVDTGLGMNISGDMQMSGVPEYSRELQAIVLKDFTVDSFNAKHVPAILDNVVRGMVQRTVGKKFGLSLPIYTLTPEQLSFAGKEWVPEKMVIEQERLSITLQPHDKP